MTYPNSSISVGFCHADISISLHFSCLSFTKRVQVTDMVDDVLYCETEDFNSHSTNIWGCDFTNQCSKCFTIFEYRIK